MLFIWAECLKHAGGWQIRSQFRTHICLHVVDSAHILTEGALF